MLRPKIIHCILLSIIFRKDRRTPVYDRGKAEEAGHAETKEEVVIRRDRKEHNTGMWKRAGPDEEK